MKQKTKLQSRISLLLFELKGILENKSEAIIKKLQEIVKEFERVKKRKPVLSDIWKLVNSFMSYEQIKRYFRGINYNIEEDKQDFTASFYVDACCVSEKFKGDEYKDKLKKVVKKSGFDGRMFHNNRRYVLNFFPELVKEEDLKLAYLSLSGDLHGAKNRVFGNLPKVNLFFQYKFKLKWEMLKEEIDNRLKDIKIKEIWTCVFKARVTYNNFLRVAKENRIDIDITPNKLHIKIKHADLFNIIDIFRRVDFDII